MHGSQCLSYPQHFAALVYCRYLYPTHLQLTTPLLTYEAPYFLSSCSPPPTNPMSVLLLLVFVLTCVLLIPFPNPGLGYRAAEKPDPLLSSSPSRYLSVSLPDYRVVLYLNGKVKWTLGLCLDCQAKSVFWHIQIVYGFFFLLESHMKCDFCKSDSNHIWRRICTDTSQSVRSNQISKCLLSHSQCEKQQWCQIQREWHQSSWADATSRAVWRTERSPGGFKMLDFHF